MPAGARRRLFFRVQQGCRTPIAAAARGFCTSTRRLLKLATPARKSAGSWTTVRFTLPKEMDAPISMADVQWTQPTRPELPFSTPFELAATKGKIWIAPRHKLPLDPSASWDSVWEVLQLKGTNWAGFQSQTACVHELWRHDLQEYLDFLKRNQFNAVRLPLNAYTITWALHDGQGAPFRTQSRCGAFDGWSSIQILDFVIDKLREIGVFVMLDMHTVTSPMVGEENECCPADDSRKEQMISDAWAILAQRYCTQPHVILADIFNEPWDTTWPVWKGFVERVGGRLLGICSRWLIAVEGAGQGNKMCWGEDIRGQYYEPISLPVADRLVFAPHTYGHFNFGYLLYDPNFPYNLPGVWDGYWGWLLATGPPLLIGEWGGQWEATEWNGRTFKSTSRWQLALQQYIVDSKLSGSFCKPLPSELGSIPLLLHSCLTFRLRMWVRQTGRSTTIPIGRAASSAMIMPMRS